jgi:hypothetical protein
MKRATRGALRARLALALTAAGVALMLGAATAAYADTSQSTNWAGYAVHRSGVRFTKVIGGWTQPRATCTSGTPTYSAVWVGLGGYSETSKALEQIGTELDCSSRGRAVSSVWYELVPAASHTTRLIVRPGDRIRASVAVSGQKVQLVLSDLTRKRSFTKTVHASVLDTTSAEWILEAPSVCTTFASCTTLPLADFTKASFGLASVKSTTGHTGSIKDRHWGVSEISLFSGGHRFVGSGGGNGGGPSAVPSSLSARGSSFTVTYRGGSGGTTPDSASASAAQVDTGRLVHPRR